MEGCSQVVHRKRSFLSTLALGVSALVVTLSLGGVAIILYGMNIADRKTETLVDAVEEVVDLLPDLRQSMVG